ncbi:MAG: cobalamin biosynthesis protein CobD [Methanomicrobiales archaeon]|nr:cobalamin biosynthesis protein CobD [Methanomicrobiales archaeon]
MIIQVVLFLSVIIDRVFGDPKTSLHPVALIGRFIGWWARPSIYPAHLQRITGIVGWILTMGLFVTPFLFFQVFAPWYVYLIFAPFLLKICFAWRALDEHVQEVSDAVTKQERARKASMLVSRDTSELDEEQVLSAAYESMAENLNDSIIAPLFWFIILGLPGAAMYRAVNTMDAMVGYRDERLLLGWWAARMDDILSFIPARICGLILTGIYAWRKRLGPAMETFRNDRMKRPGFNGGIPMSLIAGGEGVMFEKPGIYRIGKQEKTLLDAGPSIVRTVGYSTILFCLFASVTLLLWGGINNIYGI